MKKRIISQAVSLAMLTMAISQAYATDYNNETVNTSSGVINTSNTYTNAILNVDTGSGLQSGSHVFYGASVANFTGNWGVIEGHFTYWNDAQVNIGTQAAVSWEATYNDNTTVNVMSGGLMRGTHNGLRNAQFNLLDQSAITDDVEIWLWDDARITTHSDWAIAGGTIHARGRSQIEINNQWGIGGGVQNFEDSATLIATASQSIFGGQQYFYNDASLLLTESITNGDLSFANSSRFQLGSGAGISGSFTFTDNAEFLIGGSNLSFNIQSASINLDGANTKLDLGDANALVVSSLYGSGTITTSGPAGTMSRLIIDDYGTQTFSGSIISGLADIDVRKTGPGTFNLTGTIDTHRDLSIDGGLFLANGTVHSPNTIVNANSTLGGSGTVSNLLINNAGILAPGNSIGTLNVAGNLSFNPLSTYEVEVNDQGQSDHTAVAGVATLAGTVNVIAEAGSYHSGLVFNILSASGGIVNEFDHLNTNLAFLSPELKYQGNDVLITFVSNGVTPGQVSVIGGGNSNQQGVADSLPSVTSPAIGLAIQGLSVTGAMNAYTQLGGELHATAHAGMIEDSDFLRSSVLNRLANHDGNEAWMKVTNIDATTGKTGLNDDASRRANAALFGVDRQVGNDGAWTVGVVGGYGTTNTSTLRSTGRADTAHIGAYLGRAIDQVNVKVGLGYAYHSVDTERKINFGTFNSKIKGDYAAHSVQAFADVGYAFRVGAGTVEPFLNVAGVQINRESFRERNSDAALSVKSESTFTTFTTAGVRINQPVFQYRGADVALVGSVGFRNAAGDVTPSSTQRIGDGGVFDTQGNPIARNAVVFDLGLNAKITDTLVVGVGYRGQSGDNLRSHATSLNLNWLF